MTAVHYAAMEACVEAERAIAAHGPMNSLHEAYAVLMEEMDELWEAVRMKQSDTQRKPMARAELVQVAAVAIRTLAQWEETVK